MPLQSHELPQNSLSPRQVDAIPHIVAAPSIRKAARSANIGRTTIARWLQDPLFRAELDLAREAAASLVNAKLHQLLLQATVNLEELLHSNDPNLRLQATRFAFNIALKSEQHHDIRKRIDLLNKAFHLLNANQ